jgi:hypothetical protein
MKRACLRISPSIGKEIGITGIHTAGSWKKIILVMAALGLLLALQLTGMSAASAASSHPTPHATQLLGAHPDTTPSGLFEVTDLYHSNDNEFVTCTAGDHASPSILKSPDWGYTSVENHCNVRVSLAQYSNGTGYTPCVSPGAFVNIYRPYQVVGVSTNSNSC